MRAPIAVSMTLLAALWTLATLAVSAQADDQRVLMVGDRVRVTAPSLSPRRIEGTLVATDRDSLTVYSADARVGVPRSRIDKLEVARGTKSHLRTGALLGMAAGLAGGIVLSNPPSSAQSFEVNGGAVAASVLVSGTIGALVGAMIRTTRWTTLPVDKLTLGVGPAPQRGGVALALRFSWTWRARARPPA